MLDWTKTEDTNQLPVLPRPRLTFAFPAIGGLVPYAGFAYVPPVPFGGTRAVVLSGELGAGLRFGAEDTLQIGGRFHASSAKVIGDIATAFRSTDPAVEDFFQANTLGFDVSFGVELGTVTPYVSAGVVDVSTFFLVGDDGVVSNNLHPYAGPALSAGVDGLIRERFRFGAELYAAPGGNSRPDPDAESLRFGQAGHLYTARVRLAVEL